ncbi:hypothetical protein BCR43DRAFT_482632 [Syncephalastrum racemosum]|uniref:Uncharacterized protein n=1 Tax=Syncephalastrum racemosum TaxID=13706 RepID=A0A1X2HU02_SYNRA|nr:hypothetical protein BCR43DRAFT_482632 [Syncephalastrum racemosum]
MLETQPEDFVMSENHNNLGGASPFQHARRFVPPTPAGAGYMTLNDQSHEFAYSNASSEQLSQPTTNNSYYYDHPNPGMMTAAPPIGTHLPVAGGFKPDTNDGEHKPNAA